MCPDVGRREEEERREEMAMLADKGGKKEEKNSQLGNRLSNWERFMGKGVTGRKGGRKKGGIHFFI